MTAAIRGITNETVTIMDISKWNTGIYLIKFKNNKFVANKKFIKQKTINR
jgi:hypothetical protein